MLKDEYERRNEINLYDPVVMYVKNKDNRTWCFFDWAHEAGKFAPMDIEDIPENERAQVMDDFVKSHTQGQQAELLSEYAKVLAGLSKCRFVEDEFRHAHPIHPDFYKRLDEHGKKVFAACEKFHPLTARFIELMNRTEPGENAFSRMFFSQEEIDFLGKEALALFGELFPSEAEWYMMTD